MCFIEEESCLVVQVRAVPSAGKSKTARRNSVLRQHASYSESLKNNSPTKKPLSIWKCLSRNPNRDRSRNRLTPNCAGGIRAYSLDRLPERSGIESTANMR